MPMPRATEYNEDFIISQAKNNVVNILENVSNRILIESRKAKTAFESYEKDYKKTRNDEYLGGMQSMKSKMASIEREFNRINKISEIMNKIVNTSRENYIQLKQELRDSINDLRFLDDEERKNIRVAVENYLNHVSKKYPTPLVSQEEFEKQSKKFETKNPLKNIFGIFMSEKKKKEEEQIINGRKR